MHILLSILPYVLQFTSPFSYGHKVGTIGLPKPDEEFSGERALISWWNQPDEYAIQKLEVMVGPGSGM